MKINKKYKMLLEGATGRLGDMIFYQRSGKTFARQAPGSYNKIPTKKQAKVRERFAAAQQFAQAVIRNPQLKAIYEKKAGNRCTAYVKAISEYMKLTK